VLAFSSRCLTLEVQRCQRIEAMQKVAVTSATCAGRPIKWFLLHHWQWVLALALATGSSVGVQWALGTAVY
jgi:hypothetical protein